MEAIFLALFFAPGVVQLLDGEQLTADDPLSSQQCRRGAAVCPWKREEAEAETEYQDAFDYHLGKRIGLG